MMSRISGNQTNNSEQPNASVSGVSKTATDLASLKSLSAAAAAAAAAYNNNNTKQRKKRKKKKDKTSLTNQAVNCSCGKRIEGSCNSVSMCSNCVPTACVYCHFNDLAYCENYFTEHISSSPPPPPSSRFHGDLYDLNIKNSSSPIGFWPHKIETNDIRSCDFVKVTSDSSNYFMRHQQPQPQRNITTLNRRTEQLQRFAVYENLCEFCGFAIGNGAYHQHCDTSNSNSNNQHNICAVNQEQDELQKPENIYENICESCHSLFDGEQCISKTCIRNKNLTTAQIVPVLNTIPITGEVIDVLVKKPPIANRQFGKQFSEFLGSFRQRLTPKTSAESTERKKPKIEIIHNASDEVFKTNKTFDLNEIVQLRNQSLLCGERQQQRQHQEQKQTNTCSELISGSDEIVNEVPSKPIRLFRASNSDSNFLENYHLSSPHLESPYCESIVSDTILYSNSYAPPSYEDAIQHSKYASVSPFKLRARVKPKIYDSTSASSFFTYNSSSVSTLQSHSLVAANGERKSSATLSLLFDGDDSVKQWLISLKQKTDEYADDCRQFECGSTKCLPSKMLNENTVQMKWSIEHTDNRNMSSNVTNDSQTNLLRRIELFKENLMEHKMHSKRNAIYIKDSICDVTIDPDTIAPDIETTTTTATAMPMASVQSSLSLLPTSHCYSRNGSDNTETGAEIVTLRHMNQISHLPSQFDFHRHRHQQQHINHNVALEITSQYLQKLKTFYMEQVTLSTSLNRITLVCGDRRIHFWLKFLMSQPQNSLQCTNQLVLPTKYTNFQQIIELIYKMGVTKQLDESDKAKLLSLKRRESVEFRVEKGRKRSTLANAFIRRSANLVLRTPLRGRYKRSIDDFVKRKCRRASIIDVEKVKPHLNDFSKPDAKDTNISGKSLNDFTLKKTDYSPQIVVTDTECDKKDTQNEVESKVTRKESAKKNNENIYQSIWMFKTIGTALSHNDVELLNNLDTCEKESDETATHDSNEWEVAEEEFVFSTQPIDDYAVQHRRSKFYSNITRPTTISHPTHSEIQRPKMAQYTVNEKPLYHTICVLYNTMNPTWNDIIYDYNGNLMKFVANVECNDVDEGNKRNGHTAKINGSHQIEKSSEKQLANLCNEQEIAIKLDSVNAWKSMLRTVDYIDDEEDVVS